MSGISSAASSWLNSLTSTGNWLQSAASVNSPAGNDWIDGVSSQNSVASVNAYANAFASAEQTLASGLDSNIENNAVNKVVTSLQSQASAQSTNSQTSAQSSKSQTSGQSVNILA